MRTFWVFVTPFDVLEWLRGRGGGRVADNLHWINIVSFPFVTKTGNQSIEGGEHSNNSNQPKHSNGADI